MEKQKSRLLFINVIRRYVYRCRILVRRFFFRNIIRTHISNNFQITILSYTVDFKTMKIQITQRK